MKLWSQLSLNIDDIKSLGTDTDRPYLLIRLLPQSASNADTDVNDLRPPDGIQCYILDNIDLKLCIDRRDRNGHFDPARMFERTRATLPLLLDHLLGNKTTLLRPRTQPYATRNLRQLVPAIFAPRFSRHALPRQNLLSSITNSLLKFRRQRHYRRRASSPGLDTRDSGMTPGQMDWGSAIETVVKKRLWVSMIHGLQISCANSTPRSNTVPPVMSIERQAVRTKDDHTTFPVAFNLSQVAESQMLLDERPDDKHGVDMLLDESSSHRGILGQSKLANPICAADCTHAEPDWMIDLEAEESVQAGSLTALTGQTHRIEYCPGIFEVWNVASPQAVFSRHLADLEQDILLQAGCRNIEDSMHHEHRVQEHEEPMILENSAGLPFYSNKQFSTSTDRQLG